MLMQWYTALVRVFARNHVTHLRRPSDLRRQVRCHRCRCRCQGLGLLGLRVTLPLCSERGVKKYRVLDIVGDSHACSRPRCARVHGPCAIAGALHGAIDTVSREERGKNEARASDGELQGLTICIAPLTSYRELAGISLRNPLIPVTNLFRFSRALAPGQPCCRPS